MAYNFNPYKAEITQNIEQATGVSTPANKTAIDLFTSIKHEHRGNFQAFSARLKLVKRLLETCHTHETDQWLGRLPPQFKAEFLRLLNHIIESAETLRSKIHTELKKPLGVHA